MHTDERLAKLESDVAHIRADISDIKQDQREQRADLVTLGKELRNEMTALGKELRDKMATQGKELRSEIATQGKELRGEIAAIALAFEKFKGSQKVLMAILIVLQLISAGGVVGAAARALHLL